MKFEKLRRLRSSATPEARRGFATDFNAALDKLGVRPGAEFVIAAEEEALPVRHDVPAPLPAERYDGATATEEDTDRLDKQLERVRDLMLDGLWRTPAQITEATGDEWASASARLRDLRKEKFGGYELERRGMGGGLFEYRLLAPPPDPQPALPKPKPSIRDSLPAPALEPIQEQIFDLPEPDRPGFFDPV